MIILEAPYVSEVLLSYLANNGIPVLKNEFAGKLIKNQTELTLYNEQDFIEALQTSQNKSLYTVSEFALGWLYQSGNCTKLTEKISLLKNKAAFRKVCSAIYNDFYYKEIAYQDLSFIDFKNIPLPVVLKPSVGFLSTGVYIIKTEEDWQNALADIKTLFVHQAAMFPDNVVESSGLLLESYIAGREFALDVYFKDYQPVIINIFEHLFTSDTDVGDNLYLTNKNLYDRYLEKFTRHIKRLNNVLQIKDMPIHLELRMDRDQITPIEVNPMRFTGLCLNELHCHISGEHPLSYFFEKTVPNYQHMWAGKEETTFCFSVFEKPLGKQATPEEIIRIQELFANPLEFRTVQNPDLNIAAFVFSASHADEINRILHYHTK